MSSAKLWASLAVSTWTRLGHGLEALSHNFIDCWLWFGWIPKSMLPFARSKISGQFAHHLASDGDLVTATEKHTSRIWTQPGPTPPIPSTCLLRCSIRCQPFYVGQHFFGANSQSNEERFQATSTSECASMRIAPHVLDLLSFQKVFSKRSEATSWHQIPPHPGCIETKTI